MDAYTISPNIVFAFSCTSPIIWFNLQQITNLFDLYAFILLTSTFVPVCQGKMIKVNKVSKIWNQDFTSVSLKNNINNTPLIT